MKLTHIFAELKKLDDVLSQKIKTIPLEALPIQRPTQLRHSINISLKHLHTVFNKVLVIWAYLQTQPDISLTTMYIVFKNTQLSVGLWTSSLTPPCLYTCCFVCSGVFPTACLPRKFLFIQLLSGCCLLSKTGSDFFLF